MGGRGRAQPERVLYPHAAEFPGPQWPVTMIELIRARIVPHIGRGTQFHAIYFAEHPDFADDQSSLVIELVRSGSGSVTRKIYLAQQYRSRLAAAEAVAAEIASEVLLAV